MATNYPKIFSGDGNIAAAATPVPVSATLHPACQVIIYNAHPTQMMYLIQPGDTTGGVPIQPEGYIELGPFDHNNLDLSAIYLRGAVDNMDFLFSGVTD